MTTNDTYLINRSLDRNWSYCIQMASKAETSTAREKLLDMASLKFKQEEPTYQY